MNKKMLSIGMLSLLVLSGCNTEKEVIKPTATPESYETIEDVQSNKEETNKEEEVSEEDKINKEDIKQEIADKLAEMGEEDVVVKDVYAPRKKIDIDIAARYEYLDEEMKGSVIDSVTKLLGLKAQDFTLQKVDGTVINSSDYFGKPFIIEIGSTTCSACESMLEVMNNFEKSYPNVPVLKIAADESYDDIMSASNPLFQSYIPASNTSFSNDYPTRFFPTFLFIDSEGYIADVSIGTDDELSIYKTFETLK